MVKTHLQRQSKFKESDKKLCRVTVTYNTLQSLLNSVRRGDDPSRLINQFELELDIKLEEASEVAANYWMEPPTDGMSK